MTGYAFPHRLPDLPPIVGRTALPLAVAGLALAGVGASAPLAAQAHTYARVGPNDMSLCAPGKGPAVRITVSGMKSSTGHLFVRTYPANKHDWLKSKRYIMKVEATPNEGGVAVCVPLPSAGDYAIAIQHDVNGNRKTDFSTDGAGMSNNPTISTFLGIPRPPALEKVRFTAGEGVTRMAIAIRYL